MVSSEVGEAHVKEMRDQIKVTSLGNNERSNVPRNLVNDIALSSPGVLNVELLEHSKAGCKRGHCFEDPIALDIGLNLGLGHNLQPDNVMELGNPFVNL